MAKPDYPGATWHGAYSGNYTAANRPSSNPINKIIIHRVQGSYESALGWFNDSRAGVSAHYTIAKDGRVGQSVQEKDIAYHAGNWPINQTAVGFEHEGYFGDPWPDAMYRASAKLSAYLCKKYGIPVSADRFLLHRECSSTSCPGTTFDEGRYLDLVRFYAGGGSDGGSSGSGGSAATYSMVVDNGTSGRFSANSRVWGTSTYSGQRYGANYRFTKPRRRAYYANWKIRVPARDVYDVYVRYPADPGYNSRAVYRVRTTDGWRAIPVDQRSGGGRWKKLGRFALAQGDGWWVRLSSKTSGNRGYIVADAVKIVRR